MLLFLHCSIEWWWWVHVWRLASTSLPFNPCHLLLNFSKIILAFPCNFWISYLMRLSAPLNSTTFIHMLLLFIAILAQQIPSLWKRFAMDYLHHRIAWLPCTLSPFVSNLLMNLFFLVNKKTIGFSKKWNLSSLQNHNHSFWPSFVATRHFLYCLQMWHLTCLTGHTTFAKCV